LKLRQFAFPARLRFVLGNNWFIGFREAIVRRMPHENENSPQLEKAMDEGCATSGTEALIVAPDVAKIINAEKLKPVILILNPHVGEIEKDCHKDKYYT
jgi:hypothetical protein